MLTEDYRPWLIEINSSPSMESSTEITRRMCTGVLEDSIKGQIRSIFFNLEKKTIGRGSVFISLMNKMIPNKRTMNSLCFQSSLIEDMIGTVI